MKKIRVMVVDDSATVRQVISKLLLEQPDIEVIGSASDPIFALNKMQENWPDVILLDVEMPRMDGITFLKKIMEERPTPVVICSTLTEAGAKTTMEAMSAGAVEIISKPKIGLKQFLVDSSNELANAIRAASRARVKRSKVALTRTNTTPEKSQIGTKNTATQAMATTTDQVVAIGTSTGGTQALETVLRMLPRTVPGIVIVQHMPEKFTAAFAERLNSLCEVNISEAKDGDRVNIGKVLIAPGGKHMSLSRSGAQYYVTVKDGPLVNRHRPSVDVLFRSAAKYAGANALGIIMTGMGDDGARGLKEMHDVGAKTIGQDKETCVVYGMPMEAVKLGAVDREVALESIASVIIKYGS